MKHLLSIFKVLYTFITELFGVTIMPFFLVWILYWTVYLFVILGLTFLSYLVGMYTEVLVDIYFSTYSIALFFCLGCYMFYEMCWKTYDFQSVFNRLIRDMKELSQK